MRQNIQTLQSFLTKYKQFTQDVGPQLWKEDERRYRSLFERFSASRIEALKADREEATNYNVFSILKVHRKEVTTHSPFIANLLNPTGSHSHGSLFYNSFLKQVLKKEESTITNINPLHLRVRNEWHTSNFGRMDIFVQHHSHVNPFAWVIENKIGASDQEDQLENYYEYLSKEKKLPLKSIKLFYLTPYGDDPSPYSIDIRLLTELKKSSVFKNISYKTDIVKWLESTLLSIQSPSVLYVIKQYLKTIKDYCL